MSANKSLSGRRRRRTSTDERIVKKIMEVYECTVSEAWRRHNIKHEIMTINAPK